MNCSLVSPIAHQLFVRTITLSVYNLRTICVLGKSVKHSCAGPRLCSTCSSRLTCFRKGLTALETSLPRFQNGSRVVNRFVTMIPSSTFSYGCVSSYRRNLNGTRLAGCTTGCTFSRTFIAWYRGSRPMPSRNSSNWSGTRAGSVVVIPFYGWTGDQVGTVHPFSQKQRSY